MNEKVKEKFNGFESRLLALTHALMVLNYDGDTAAPKMSENVRNDTVGTLSEMSYELCTAPETVFLLDELAGAADTDEITRRKAELLLRDYNRLKKYPKDEYVEFEKLKNSGISVWHEAKKNNDYKSFGPVLQKIFDTTKRFALYENPDKDPYETMLDRFERGLTVSACDEFFGGLKKRLVPIAEKAAEKSRNIPMCGLDKSWPVRKQRELSAFLMKTVGLDTDRCIIGETEHPYTTNFTKYDVRITTHYHKNMVLSSMYSVMHESGHALYEQGIDDNITHSVLGSGVSMAIHESQSRFYENIIGRSEEFCDLIFPYLRKKFPVQTKSLTPGSFHAAVCKSEPSLIRTEADEVTYCLHIMIRYELERRLLSGELPAAELPFEWNRLYKEYLGIVVPSDREGVLQDMHWASGDIGYFPSYAIGSAYGAQYLKEIKKDFDFWGAVAAGDFGRINGWFREKIWKYGCLKDPCELFKDICGNLDYNVFADYLAERYN